MCLPFMHKWTIKSSELVSVYQHTTLPVRQHRVYTLVCSKCGWISSRKIKL